MGKIRCLTRDDYYLLVRSADLYGNPQPGSSMKCLMGVPLQLAWNQARDVVILSLLGEAGLRLSELHRLEWYDLYHRDQMRHVIQIARSKYEEKYRDVPLTRLCIDAISRYKAHEYQMFGAVDEHTKICRVYKSGRHMSRRAIQKLVQRIGELALGRRIWPHMLRHTYATRLIRTTDIRTVQNLLGHSRLDTTAIYTHPGIVEAVAGAASLGSSEGMA